MASLSEQQIALLRTLCEGNAVCPSCGSDVHPCHDLCPACDEDVVVEPASMEFLQGPPFADRATVLALLNLLESNKRDP